MTPPRVVILRTITSKKLSSVLIDRCFMSWLLLSSPARLQRLTYIDHVLFIFQWGKKKMYTKKKKLFQVLPQSVGHKEAASQARLIKLASSEQQLTRDNPWFLVFFGLFFPPPPGEGGEGVVLLAGKISFLQCLQEDFVGVKRWVTQIARQGRKILTPLAQVIDRYPSVQTKRVFDSELYEDFTKFSRKETGITFLSHLT